MAQHSSITGKTLQALQVYLLNWLWPLGPEIIRVAPGSWNNQDDLLFWQDYVAVLEKYFPGRMEMMLFLRYIYKI